MLSVPLAIGAVYGALGLYRFCSAISQDKILRESLIPKGGNNFARQLQSRYAFTVSRSHFLEFKAAPSTS
jgi:hypothetical protein